jgi:hypothetical protein
MHTKSTVTVLVTVATVLLLAGCTSGGGAATSGSPSAPASGSASPSEEPSATPTPTPTVAPVYGDLKAPDIDKIKLAISDHDYTSLGIYLGNPVEETIAGSGKVQQRAPASVIADLAYVDGTTGWTWDVDAATLATWVAGPYGAYFTTSSIVGKSAEGYVISITIVKKEIKKVFVTADVNLLVS